jgi:hypothetical protein
MPDELRGSAVEAKAWVWENSSVVEEAYQRFLQTGDWPGVAELQRHFDQRGAGVDVQKVIDSKPRVLNEARLAHTDRLVLQLRHLMWVENAKALVAICLRAIQRAVESYFSDDELPGVTSEDNLTNFPSDLKGGLRKLAFPVLVHEYPSPFGGASMQGERWRIEVDTRFARRFKDIGSIADFVARQDVIRAETAREAAAMAASYPALDIRESVFEIPPAELDASAAFETLGESGTESETELHQEPQPKLFLSWGRLVSKAVAGALRPILEKRLPGVEIFFSPTSIEPGADPSRRMFDEGLLLSSALVVVLTRESAESAYVIWETAVAWARDQLVIPVFVDIEPENVSGPLTSKVQGVHLDDKADMGRGLASLTTRFNVPPAIPLSDEEHRSLLEAAETASAPDAERERRSLVNQLRGYVARWQVLYEGLEGSPSVEDRVRLAAEIQQVLAEAVRVAFTTAEDPALAAELSKLAKEAATVKRIRVYIDSGISFAKLDDGCRNLIKSVRAAVDLTHGEP